MARRLAGSSNSTLIVMLGGGTKSTQARDIEKAIAMAQMMED